MAASERRNGVSRRGMTVLGKVPIVPKPINLPSQRSTFCWGKFPNGGGLSGKFESALVDPVGSVDMLQNGTDVQVEKIQVPRVNSATATPVVGSNNVQKTEETKTAGSYIENGKQEITGPSLQKGGDVASVPPGFSQSNSSNPSNGVASGMHSKTQHSCSQHKSGAKEREIIVIHVVGGPGFYGNFPPHIGFPERYNRNGVSGTFPLQFGNFEPFIGLQGHGGRQLPMAAHSEYYDEGEGYVCYEKECFKGACREVGRHRNDCMNGSFRENSFVDGVQEESCGSLKPVARHACGSRSLSHGHLSRSAGRSESLHQNGRVVSREETNCYLGSQKQITLLTKLSQHGLQPKSYQNATEGDKEPELFAGHVSSSYLNAEFYNDEGKAPIEALEDRNADKDLIEMPEDVSLGLEIIDGEKCSKESEPETVNVSPSKITCNDKCSYCKGTAMIGVSPRSLCQLCETTVCESSFSSSHDCLEPGEEVPVSKAEMDSSADGGKADIKHVVLDADYDNDSAVKSCVFSHWQKTSTEKGDCYEASQRGNSEVAGMGTGLSSELSPTKCERWQKLVYVKKSQLKLTGKLGLCVSKAHVKTRRFGLQGTKVVSAMSSNSSSKPGEILEAAKIQQETGLQKSIPMSTSQLSHVEVSKASIRPVALVHGKAERQRKFVYQKRIAEQATNERQHSKEKSEAIQSSESLSAVWQGECALEHVEAGLRQTRSAAGLEYHVIRRRVYQAVDGSEGHFLSPTAAWSCDDNNEKQLEKVGNKRFPMTSPSSLHCATDSHLLQESAVETKSCDSFSGTLNPSLQPSRSFPCSKRQECNITKKPEKYGRQLSGWRPKGGSQVAISKSYFIKNERETNPSTLAPVKAAEEHPGLPNTGLISALNTLHQSKGEEEESSGFIHHDLFLELKGSNHGAGQWGEKNQHVNHLEESPLQDKRLANISERCFPQEDVNGSVKQAGEMAPCRPMMVNPWDNLALKVAEGPNRQEVVAEGCKAFVKKKLMSHEKADRYHQMLFKRYKEIGQWIPKANVLKKSTRGKRTSAQARMIPSQQVDQWISVQC